MYAKEWSSWVILDAPLAFLFLNSPHWFPLWWYPPQDFSESLKVMIRCLLFVVSAYKAVIQWFCVWTEHCNDSWIHSFLLILVCIQSRLLLKYIQLISVTLPSFSIKVFFACSSSVYYCQSNFFWSIIFSMLKAVITYKFN